MSLPILRFGHQLRTSLIKDWEWNYIDYDRLKALLQNYETEPSPSNPRPKKKPEWSEDDEQSFVKELEAELDKVFTFQKVKSQEIVQRIKASEAEVGQVLGRLESAIDDQKPTDEDFELLEEDLSDIIADVHDLGKFTQLNYTGFQKIIKKHDVRRLGFSSFLLHLLTMLETNQMASQARLRRPVESQTIFQGQLRCLHRQAVQAV
jgi:DNA replication licensing factor MCM4